LIYGQVSRDETMAIDQIPSDPVWKYLRRCEWLAIDGTDLVNSQPVPDANVAKTMPISARERRRTRRIEDRMRQRVKRGSV
jgi:hypothetical protein